LHNIKSLLYDIGPVHEIYYCRVSLMDAKADGDSVLSSRNFAPQPCP